MIWQIAIRARRDDLDGRGRAMCAAARRAGIAGVSAIRATRLYQLEGEIHAETAAALAEALWANPVVETWQCTPRVDWPESEHPLVEVHLQPGVMDPVALSALAAACELLPTLPRGAEGRVTAVRTAWRYEIVGAGSREAVETIARQVLANACIESIFLCGFGRRDAPPQTFPHAPELPFEARTVRLAGLSDEQLARLSRDAHLFLNVEEMKAIRAHFAALGREPTDLELETLAQTWSEHCVHKTLKAAVEYRGRGFGRDARQPVTKSYDNLLKDTIVRATRELNKPWCLSVFEDNAGVIAFDEEYGIAFKVETHNHPSAIEPYGGAATGAGGCIRDILGCGLGAKPIAATDVFCVADPSFDDARLPTGVLAPRRILRGIVAGVRDYGNRMGIPTVAGALHFDDRYLANPLVFCGCVGLIPRSRIAKAPRRGDRIVVVGGRTGRDGIGGATFSSAELTDTHADEFAHAVQIGNAIEEKKVLDALLAARDHEGGCLYSAVTDCGAGGLSSAVGEMGEKLGAEVDLETVPLKYSGLRYNEIWLSEAQERMVLAVPPENLEKLLAVFAAEEVETAVIGTFTGDKAVVLRYQGVEVGRLDVTFLHEGVPKRRLTARWDGPEPEAAGAFQTVERHGDLNDALLQRLAHLNTCARESVFRQYDHEVQGGTVIKPAVGIGEGPSDAAVIRPLPTSWRGVAIGGGMCPSMSDVDPYYMAVEAIDEAIRNVICVGADPERIALLDNFCWGGCDDEASLGALVRACQGCYDAAMAFGTPFISGKDSLNNQFSLSAEDARRLELPARLTIPPTLLISAVGVVEDVRRCTTSDLKQPGNRLIAVSAHKLPERAALHRAVGHLMRSGEVAACHDVSDGGLAVCLAEMCIGGRLGAEVEFANFKPPEGSAFGAWLFHVPRSSYVLEVPPHADLSPLNRVGHCMEMGVVAQEPTLRISCGCIAEHIALDVDALNRAWRRPLGLDEGA